MAGRTLFEKVWQKHVVFEREDGEALLFVDRHYVHEGSFHAFAGLECSGRPVRRPDLTFGFADHYVPTRDRSNIPDPEIRNMVRLFDANTSRNDITAFGLGDPRQGIVHVVAPEQGLSLPGLLIVCGDSHTSTHGALGALAFGIGASEAGHVLATQTIWQRRPKTMRVRFEGTLAPEVTAKDVMLSLIAQIGASGAVHHVIEYGGPVIEAMSMAGRMTICNMSIEAGARAGMIAPDAIALDWLQGRPFVPKGVEWDTASKAWAELHSDPDAVFDAELTLDACAIAPTVTWGNSPEDALPITALIPDPDAAPSPTEAARMRDTLDYMGLKARAALEGLAVDRVFIGSCTNARIEDLRAVAGVVYGRRAVVPTIVVPGSTGVALQAEAEGLADIFRTAGMEWRASGCSMCAGTNGDLIGPGERCAATTNRNFRGRQGPGSRTHLMSPAMAAAACVTGRLTDVRKLIRFMI